MTNYFNDSVEHNDIINYGGNSDMLHFDYRHDIYCTNNCAWKCASFETLNLNL